MSDRNRFDKQYAYQFILFTSVNVQYLIVYRLAMSNRIQSQIWRRAKFSLNLYHIIIIKLHNRNLHVGELGFKLSQREVYSMLHKPLIKKGVQQHTVCTMGMV